MRDTRTRAAAAEIRVHADTIRLNAEALLRTTASGIWDKEDLRRVLEDQANRARTIHNELERVTWP